VLLLSPSFSWFDLPSNEYCHNHFIADKLAEICESAGDSRWVAPCSALLSFLLIDVVISGLGLFLLFCSGIDGSGGGQGHGPLWLLFIQHVPQTAAMDAGW
jgi:hypothetical protein